MCDEYCSVDEFIVGQLSNSEYKFRFRDASEWRECFETTRLFSAPAVTLRHCHMNQSGETGGNRHYKKSFEYSFLKITI